MPKVQFNPKTGYTKKLKYTFHYRFTCQRCGICTKWIPYEVFGEGVVAVKGIASAMNQKNKNQLEKLAKAHINYEIEEIKGEIAHNNYRRFKSKCPGCQKRQFWGKPISKAFTLFYGLFIAFLWCAIVIIAGSMDLLLGAVPNTILMCFGVAVIFYDSHVYLMLKTHFYNKRLSGTNNPIEFDWKGNCEEVAENAELYI